ncbi:hypothetical protein QUB70_07175 [Microcoleus sp. A003_D6]|uniref:hypothetical protein n=1 Tax=Microcoleus sp. A003_D6 TaxID=3055266 RepID=UPI002FD4BA24
MVLQPAANIHSDADSIDWSESWMVGDALRARKLRDEDQLCAAAAAYINFIWANLMLKRFGGADCEEPQQLTKMVKQFDHLIQL